MFIMAKRNVILPSKDGTQKHAVKRDYVGEIPDWAADTDYFRALVKDGKIAVPESTKDKDTQAADEKPVTVRRGKTTTKE